MLTLPLQVPSSSPIFPFVLRLLILFLQWIMMPLLLMNLWFWFLWFLFMLFLFGICHMSAIWPNSNAILFPDPHMTNSISFWRSAPFADPVHVDVSVPTLGSGDLAAPVFSSSSFNGPLQFASCP